MAAPVQRGTAHLTFTAPTSTIGTIDADTFSLTRGADQISINNESGEKVLEVFNDPRIEASFEMTMKAAQTPLKPGDLMTLTFPASHTPTGAVECVVLTAEDSGYGKVIRQRITVKKHDAADYSP